MLSPRLLDGEIPRPHPSSLSSTSYSLTSLNPYVRSFALRTGIKEVLAMFERQALLRSAIYVISALHAPAEPYVPSTGKNTSRGMRRGSSG